MQGPHLLTLTNLFVGTLINFSLLQMNISTIYMMMCVIKDIFNARITRYVCHKIKFAIENQIALTRVMK